MTFYDSNNIIKRAKNTAFSGIFKDISFIEVCFPHLSKEKKMKSINRNTIQFSVPNLLSRKEFAFYCNVSLSTVDRGIRDNRWPYNAYYRVSPRRIVYPASLVASLGDMALSNIHKNPNV